MYKQTVLYGLVRTSLCNLLTEQMKKKKKNDKSEDLLGKLHWQSVFYSAAIIGISMSRDTTSWHLFILQSVPLQHSTIFHGRF